MWYKNSDFLIVGLRICFLAEIAADWYLSVNSHVLRAGSNRIKFHLKFTSLVHLKNWPQKYTVVIGDVFSRHK